MWACYKGHAKVADALIKTNKVNLNVRADNAMTCLMWAAGRGYLDVCKLLVQNEASVNATDKFGNTAFLWFVVLDSFFSSNLTLKFIGLQDMTEFLVQNIYSNTVLFQIQLAW